MCRILSVIESEMSAYSPIDLAKLPAAPWLAARDILKYG